MAERVRGEFTLDSNYDLSIRKPLDARSLVPTYESLMIKDNWMVDGKIAAYNGMIVAVADTNDASKNGIYFLFDQKCTSKLKSPDVEDPANWIKVGETSDISDFVNRVTTIESELDSIKSRLNVLENSSDIVTYGYRKIFPETGEEGKLYIAADEQKSYVWIDGVGYLCVGEENDEYTEINGGSADTI
jgi:hypothetical protein